MRGKIVLLCVVALLIAGCAAPVPQPTAFPYSEQPQLQSATHWQGIARVTVDRMASIDILKPDASGNRHRLYVQAAGAIPFEHAFRGYLITELINAGFLVSENPDSPIRLHWNLQLVDRFPERPLKAPGIPVALFDTVKLLIFGYFGTGDFAVPHTEFILTTKVTVGNDSVDNTISRYSDTFYINDGDWNNYQVAISQPVSNVHPRSISAKDEAWRSRLKQKGFLSD